MDTKKQHIFNLVVNDYLNTGKPIASEYLVKKYKLNLSPATIRNYFKEFGEEELMEKSHFSSGRIPTDLGIKRFAGWCSEKSCLGNVENYNLERIFSANRKVEEVDILINELTKTLSDLVNVAGIGFVPGKKILFKCGLSKLISGFDLLEKNSMVDILSLFETIDEQMFRSYECLNINSVTVFIGNENPFFYNNNLSLIINRISWPNNEFETIISVFGPKRMMYSKAISALNRSAELMNNWPPLAKKNEEARHYGRKNTK